MSMAARAPSVRSPTPTPRTISRKTSAQSIRRDIRSERNHSIDSSNESPTVSVMTPGSNSTHNSVYSDRESRNSSPSRIAGLAGLHLGDNLRAPEGHVHQLFSPSAPPKQPGDELLYNVDSERRPDERIFSQAFQSALEETKGELRELSLAIWGCTAAHQAGTGLYALRQQGQSLSEFEPMRTRTVGLVGDSGAGKSSLINSLLDQPNLARSTGDGSACTCVVTEYRFRPTHEEEPYGIEVDYMTAEEVKELLEELLRTFKQCFIPAFNDVDSIQEQNEIREKSSKAWETLQSMFRDRPELTQGFLKQESTGEEASVLSTLQEWATAVLAKRPGGANTSTWSATATDVDDCTDKLDPFVRDPVDEKLPSLWPFVRIIRVYLRSPILQTGLILVDLPGLRNLNFARARATERYLRNCHEVFAVTTVARASTDAGVRDVIARTGRHRPLRIICTKSELVNARETERSSPPDVALQIRTWRRQIDNLHLQMRRCEARRRRGVPGALEEEVRTRDILNEIDFGLKKLLIERRNHEVAHDLIEKYQGQVQLGDLKVFCVSNVDYFNHRHDEQNRAESRLELSGIVNLRRYCHKIPAEAQFAAAAAYVEHEVPAFIGSLRQWSVAGSDQLALEKAELLQELLKQSESTLCKRLVMPSGEVHKAMTNLNYEFAASVVLPIRENRADWRTSSVEISKEWAGWNASSYAAFCRKYGNSETTAVGARSWNEELIRPMRLQLESNWGFFEEWVDECKGDLIDMVGRVFDDVCEPLKDYMGDAPNTVGNLLDNIGPRKECIFRIIDAGFDDLVEGTSQIENDTLYGHDSSYTSDIMRSAYQACNQESGSGSDARRKELISRHIQACRLFPKLSTMVERNHRSFVRATFDSLIGDITREVDNFVRDLGLLAGPETETPEAQRYPEFARRLRVRLVQADRVLVQCAQAARKLREAREEGGLRH